MIRTLLIVFSLLLCCSACSSISEVEPEGLIAKVGSTPTIDGVFDPGEWDDAEIVRAGGGNIVFDGVCSTSRLPSSRSLLQHIWPKTVGRLIPPPWVT